jgi:hypothetical protein
MIEVVINFYVLFINLSGVPAVWKRVFPIIVGLLPGIAFGASMLASLQPAWVKFGTYSVILPLILLQAAGWRRPIRSTWVIGLPFGSALGVLYSVTTISGPPLAILFNNLGLFIAESQNILIVLIPVVAVGIPLGAYVIRRLDAETFRRICMSFDAWIVGFGLSRVLIELRLMDSPLAYSVMAATALVDLYLLHLFFTARRAALLYLSSDTRGNVPEATEPWWAPLSSSGGGRASDRYASTRSAEDVSAPFGLLGDLLGYVIAILGVSMLAYVVFGK